MRRILAILGLFVVLAGFVFAMSGAQTSAEVERGRWAGNTTSPVATEGGNISGVNVSLASLTEKWAAFYGNVTGTIVLTDAAGANNVYSWTYTTATGGEVCVSQDNAPFPWGSAEATTALEVDTAWGFGSQADNATNTLTAPCSITTDEVGSITSVGANHQGASSFQTCAIGDGTEAAEPDFAFCANISAAGTNYNNESANYEIMVPTTNTAGATETYYFYAELG